MCLGIPVESVFEQQDLKHRWEVSVDEPSQVSVDEPSQDSVDEPAPLLTAAARRRIKQRLRRKMDKQAPEAPQPMKMTLELDTLCPSALQSTVKSVAGQDAKKPAVPAMPLAPLRSLKPELEVTKTEAPILASFAPTALGSTMLVPVCALPIVMQVEEKPQVAQINASHLASLPFEKTLSVEQQESWNTDDEMDASTADATDSAMTTTSAKSSCNGQLFEISEFRCPVNYIVRKTFIELDDEDVVPECSRKRASSAPPPPSMQDA